MDEHSRPNPAAIRLHSLKLDLDPVLLSRKIVSQQRRRLVHVDDENVYVPIVVEIAERAAAAGMKLCNSRPRFGAKLFERRISQITKNDVGRFIGKIGQLALNFRIDIPRYNENVGIPIVVEIDNARSPTDESRLHANLRSAGAVVETSLPVISVNAARIVQ